MLLYLHAYTLWVTEYERIYTFFHTKKILVNILELELLCMIRSFFCFSLMSTVATCMYTLSMTMHCCVYMLKIRVFLLLLSLLLCCSTRCVARSLSFDLARYVILWLRFAWLLACSGPKRKHTIKAYHCYNPYWGVYAAVVVDVIVDFNVWVRFYS